MLEFQFHKGTIRTDVPGASNLEKSNFNSIKVQLEHYDATVIYQDRENFNSIKVQLERRLPGYPWGLPYISIP